MIGFIFVQLFFVISHCQFSPHEALCNNVEYPDVCVVTWGCYWNEGDFCAEQDSYQDGVGTCPTDEYYPGYTCFASDSGYYYVYDLSAPYDDCSFAEYDSDGICPEISPDGYPCVFWPTSLTDEVGGCYVDPAYGLSWDFSEAGICGGRKAGGGCLGIPNCDWANNSCKPDDLCYYNYTNGGLPVTAKCPTTALGGHCSFDAVLDICSSDPISAAAKTCMQAYDGTQATCEAAGCEWVPEGTYTAWAGLWDGKYDSYLSFSGWCVPIGSSTSVVRMPAFAIVVLFVAVLALL